VNLALSLDDQFDADKDEACRRPTLSDRSYDVESGVPDDPPVFIAESMFVHRGFGPTRMARSSPTTMGTTNLPNAPATQRRVLHAMLPRALKPDLQGALQAR
jgi:hypothetical protein